MEVLQRTANRGSISTGYDIDNSCKFEADNSEELNFTPSSSGSNQTWTFSCWFKQTELDATGTIFGHYTSADNQALVRRLDTNEFSFRLVNGGTVRELKSDMLFRDTLAWYHLVVAVDTTDGTSTNRVKVYVNGEQISLTGTYPTSSLGTYGINTSSLLMDIGGTTTAGGTFRGFCGYLAEIHHIDGSQLAPTDFGETDEDTGIWKPKQISGLTYGTNGFYLDFSDASDLGNDASGNGNDFTLNNITAADQATDTPTNNFCTLNVISAIGNNTYTEGATKGIANAQNEQAEGTFMINKGKWYFEAQNITSYGAMFGFGKPNNWATSNPNNPGNDTSSFAIANDGNVYYNNNTAASGWAAYATTDKAMIAVDLDNGFCYFGKNGIWGNSGDPTSGSSGTGGFNYVSLVTNISLGDELVPALRISYTQTHGAMFNFGGYTIMTISSAASDDNGYGTFEYAPPSGYYALCTKNLAEYG